MARSKGMEGKCKPEYFNVAQLSVCLQLLAAIELQHRLPLHHSSVQSLVRNQYANHIFLPLSRWMFLAQCAQLGMPSAHPIGLPCLLTYYLHFTDFTRLFLFVRASYSRLLSERREQVHLQAVHLYGDNDRGQRHRLHLHYGQLSYQLPRR